MEIKKILKTSELTLSSLKKALQDAVGTDNLGFVFIEDDKPGTMENLCREAQGFAATIKDPKTFITFPVKIYTTKDPELETEAFSRFCRNRDTYNIEDFNRYWRHPYEIPIFWRYMDQLGLNESDYVLCIADGSAEKHVNLSEEL